MGLGHDLGGAAMIAEFVWTIGDALGLVVLIGIALFLGCCTLVLWVRDRFWGGG